MKTLFNIIFILLLISFLPIPIKLSGIFNKDDYYLKLYGFSLLKKGRKKGEPPKKKEEKPPAKKVTKEPKQKEKFDLFKFLKERIELKILYRNFKNSKFKPRLRVDGFFNYALGDPMQTALSYGAINMFLPIVYRGILLLFRSKKFKFDINPTLQGEGYLNVKLNCIIFFSIAHIIYMLFLIFKSILDTREVNPL